MTVLKTVHNLDEALLFSLKPTIFRQTSQIHPSTILI